MIAPFSAQFVLIEKSEAGESNFTLLSLDWRAM